MRWKAMDAINSIISGYNKKRYWEYHYKFADKNTPTILRYYYLYKMKKMESKNGASFGHRINHNPHFASIPSLPHGLRGIFIANNAVIGHGCTIYQQVTIGQKCPNDYSAPTIGDNCLIGAGAKIIGGCLLETM